MLHGRQIGRKGGLQIVADAVDQEAPALPAEVVVVGDGGQARFGDEFGQGQGEGDIERDGQDILGNERVKAKFGDKAPAAQL